MQRAYLLLFPFEISPIMYRNNSKTYHLTGIRHVVRVQVFDEHVECSLTFFRKSRRIERGFLAVYHYNSRTYKLAKVKRKNNWAVASQFIVSDVVV